MTWVGFGVTVAGGLYSAGQQKRGGKKAQAELQDRSERRAKQMREQAVQERATGQFAANEQRRQMEIMISNAQATVAASGGGTVDPTVIKLMLGLKEEGERAATGEIYQSETAAQGMESGAIEEISQGYAAGSAARRAGNAAAMGTLIETGANAYSMYSKYSNDTPKTRDPVTKPTSNPYSLPTATGSRKLKAY